MISCIDGALIVPVAQKVNLACKVGTPQTAQAPCPRSPRIILFNISHDETLGQGVNIIYVHPYPYCVPKFVKISRLQLTPRAREVDPPPLGKANTAQEPPLRNPNPTAEPALRRRLRYSPGGRTLVGLHIAASPHCGASKEEHGNEHIPG